MEKAAEEPPRDGFSQQDSCSNSKSFQNSCEESDRLLKEEYISTLDDDSLLELLKLCQPLDPKSSAVTNYSPNDILPLPEPNKFIILLHGNNPIVIYNIDGIMHYSYISPTGPVSPTHAFQKIMIQLGLSPFGDPPIKKLEPLRTAYGWLADAVQSRKELLAAADSADSVSYSLGFNNRIWSRSIRLHGLPAKYERYELKAHKKKLLEFTEVEAQNDIVKGVWFELGELSESNWKDEPSQEFRNIALAFFNGEEVFEDDRYESDNWKLGQTTEKQVPLLEFQPQILTAENRACSVSDNSDSNEIRVNWRETNSHVDINISRRSSDWSIVLEELHTALNDKGDFACFLIDIVLNNRLESAMKPEDNPSRRYHGMVISNFQDKFKAICDSLDKTEAISDPSLAETDQWVEATDTMVGPKAVDESVPEKKQSKKKKKKTPKKKVIGKGNSVSHEVAGENAVAGVSDDEQCEQMTTVVLPETPLNAFSLDAHTEQNLEGEWNVVKKGKSTTRKSINNVRTATTGSVSPDQSRLGGRSTEGSNLNRHSAKPIFGTSSGASAHTSVGPTTAKSIRSQQGKSAIRTQSAQKRVTKSKDIQQAPPGNVKQGAQHVEFEFNPEDYPAMPPKPSIPTPVVQLKGERVRPKTPPTTLPGSPSLKNVSDDIMVDVNAKDSKKEHTNKTENNGAEDEFLAEASVHKSTSELDLSITSDIVSRCSSSKEPPASAAPGVTTSDSIISAVSSAAKQLSRQLVKPRAGSQPLTGPKLSNETSIRSSKSDTDLFVANEINLYAPEDQDNEADQADSVAYHIASANSEDSKAVELEHVNLIAHEQSFKSMANSSAENEHMNSILEAAIYNHQAGTKEDNTPGIATDSLAFKADSKQPYEPDHNQKNYQNEEGINLESAYTPRISSPDNVDQAIGQQPGPQMNPQSSPNIDVSGQRQPIGNTLMPYGIMPFFNNGNGQNVPPFVSESRNPGSRINFGPPTIPTLVSRSYQTQNVSRTGSCSYCRAKTTASSEKPVWLCIGCGPKASVCYCSRDCLLSHAFEHSAECEQSFDEDTISMYPLNIFMFEALPITPLHNKKMPRHMFRQNVFSIYCRQSRIFPQLLSAWCKRMNQTISSQDSLRESQKRTGDYCVFSRDSFGRNTFHAEVIFTMSPRLKERKHALNRALNASFRILNGQVLEFLFLLIHEAIHDREYYEIPPGYSQSNVQAFQQFIFKEFRYQFEMEFSFDTHKQNTALAREFHFETEWPIMSKLIGGLERSNPILMRWHTLYGALYGREDTS